MIMMKKKYQKIILKMLNKKNNLKKIEKKPKIQAKRTKIQV